MTNESEPPITEDEREVMRQVIKSFDGTDYQWPDVTDAQLDETAVAAWELDEIDANSIMTQSNVLGIDVGRHKAIIAEAWYALNAPTLVQEPVEPVPSLPRSNRSRGLVDGGLFL